jgi:hypothetical protein
MPDKALVDKLAEIAGVAVRNHGNEGGHFALGAVAAQYGAGTAKAVARRMLVAANEKLIALSFEMQRQAAESAAVRVTMESVAFFPCGLKLALDRAKLDEAMAAETQASPASC